MVYTTPTTSQEAAKQVSQDALATFHGQISDHGIKDLDASIQLSQLDVGGLQVFTDQRPLPIPRTHLPIILAISWARGPAIEIAKLDTPYPADAIDPLFEAVNQAFEQLAARLPQDRFTLVRTEQEAVAGDKLLHFNMVAVQAGAGGLNNAAATAAAGAFHNFLVDIDPGDMEFEIFVTEPEYLVVAQGDVWLEEVDARKPVQGVPNTGSYETA